LITLFLKWIKDFSSEINVVLPLASNQNCIAIGAAINGVPRFVVSKCLIYAGGGYFGEPSTQILKWSIRNWFRHLLLGVFSKCLGKPYAIIGVGAGPITNRLLRNSSVKLFNGAQIVAVRDEESCDYLVKYGVAKDKIILAADAALAMDSDDIPGAFKQKAKSMLAPLDNKIKVGIHFTHDNSNQEQQSQLQNELIEFAKKTPNLGFVVFTDFLNPTDILSSDEKIAKKIVETLGTQALFIPYADNWTMLGVISELRITVTTKLHVGIVSVALGKEVLSFPHHQKTPRFYKQIGMQNRCTPISEYTPGLLGELLNGALDNEKTFELPIDIRNAALNNKRLVHNFLREFV